MGADSLITFGVVTIRLYGALSQGAAASANTSIDRFVGSAKMSCSVASRLYSFFHYAAEQDCETRVECGPLVSGQRELKRRDHQYCVLSNRQKS